MESSGFNTLDYWTEFQMCDQLLVTFDDEFQAFKKPRVSETIMNSASRMPISSTNRSQQTRPRKPVCLQFRRGKCNYGLNCNFAHNVTGDVGQFLNPSSSEFQSEHGHEMIGKKRCWWFICGKECPYGDDCVFGHRSVKNAGGGLIVSRENAAITLVNSEAGAGVGGQYRRGCEEFCRGFKNLSYIDSQIQQKKVFWKTTLCRQWARSGSCSYGVKCHFAHGEAELQKLSLLPPLESEALAVESLSIVTKGAASSNKESVTAYKQQKDVKCLIRWNDVEKISRIYADWI